MGQQIESALLQSLHRIVLVLASFLPGVAAFLLAFILFTLLGFGLSAIVRRILAALHFDERLASRRSPDSSSLLVDWSPMQSPSLLLARSILWLCVIAGVAIGASAFDAFYSSSFAVSAFVLPYLTRLTGAALILIAGSLVARFLERSVLIGAVNAQMQYARFLSLGIKWLVWVLTSAMALDHLRIGGSIVELAFGILFGGIVLTLSLAIGLGSRDLVSRSLEKTLDRPSSGPTAEPTPFAAPPAKAKPTLRHF